MSVKNSHISICPEAEKCTGKNGIACKHENKFKNQVNMSSKPKPNLTIVTICTHGIYHAKMNVYYYRPWMLEFVGTRVYVLSDLFSTNQVQIYTADTDDFLGYADLYKTRPRRVLEIRKGVMV